MQTSDVTQDRLQRLATFAPADGARVLSLYLNLDPTANLHLSETRRSAVNSLLDEAARAVEGEEDLDHDAHMALREDVARARAELDANLDDGWAEGAHALALFLCGPADLFEVLRLPKPVDSRVTIADRPAIEPLAEVGPAEHWAVLLLDGNDARLLEGFGDRLEEVGHEHSDHGGRTRRGGMSAMRYERSVGMEENEFLRGAARMLDEADGRRAYRMIFVGTTERTYSTFLDALSQPLRERINGRFDVGADWESVSSVQERLQPLLRTDESHREREALDRVGAGGLRGIVDVLPALYERRVATLLIEPGLEHPGVVCPKCRWAMAEERGTCPVDGETMVEHPNLVEWAVELAVEQDAEVLPVRRHDDLSDHDGIAVALRF
jgi:peptide subunit release factor 1 (eRF1)